MIYRDLVVESRGPPVATLLVQEVEALLGCALPSDYREFLVECNGGHMGYQIEVSFPNGFREYLEYGSLYSVDHGEWETNPFELRRAREDNQVPPQGVLPIARDGGGSVLYIDLRAGYRVVAFVEGLPGWTGRSQESSLVEVATSFDEYLSKLVICDDIARDHIESFDITPESIRATVQWLDSRSKGWRAKFADIWNLRVRGEQS